MKILFKNFNFIGNHCGYDPGFENYTNIYFIKPESSDLKNYVCVSECPTNTSKTLNCHPTNNTPTCDPAYIYDSMKCIDKYKIFYDFSYFSHFH